MEDEMTPGIQENDVTTQIKVGNEGNVTFKEKLASTSRKEDSIEIDIANKIAITCNVLKVCISEKTEHRYFYHDSIPDRLAYLTNLPRQLLSTFLHMNRQRNRISKESILETPEKHILIRRILTKYYAHKGKIPKSEFLYKYLGDPSRLDEELRLHGYIWRRLHNTRRAIIVEHPKRVIERQLYLQKIMRYRNENRRIVYVETKYLSGVNEQIHNYEKDKTKQVLFDVVFIVVDIKNKGFLTGNVFYRTEISKCQKVIEDHIIKNVIPILTKPSVIILEDKPFYRKSLPVPTIDSEKSEMIKWLDCNEIPHTASFHRSELFELIQKCKNKSDFHKFDAVLHSHGHEILRRPSNTEYINYFQSLFVDNISSKEKFITSISQKSLKFWNDLETTIIQDEKTVLTEDLEMENITDKILTMAINTDVNNLANLECDQHVDSLTQEEILIELKNSFSPDNLNAFELSPSHELKRQDVFMEFPSAAAHDNCDRVLSESSEKEHNND